MRLKGKTAIVTGASKGIGAAIARHLAAEGAAVTVNYATSREGADKVVSQIAGEGGKAIAVQANTSNQEDVNRLFDETLKAFGSVDIVVNNAGVYEFAPIEEVTVEHYERQFSTNVLGPVLVSGRAVKHLPKGGSIINISSVVSIDPPVNSAIYSATKGAVDVITKTLAKELGPKGIRVNAVLPGPVDTEGFATAGIKGSEFEQHLVATTPLGRLGAPEDIARAVTYLATEDAGWITGQTIKASGGL